MTIIHNTPWTFISNSIYSVQFVSKYYIAPYLIQMERTKQHIPFDTIWFHERHVQTAFTEIKSCLLSRILPKIKTHSSTKCLSFRKDFFKRVAYIGKVFVLVTIESFPWDIPAITKRYKHAKQNFCIFCLATMMYIFDKLLWVVLTRNLFQQMLRWMFLVYVVRYGNPDVKQVNRDVIIGCLNDTWNK